VRCKIAILGGGISGVILANELAKSSAISVSLLERSPWLGGLHRSIRVGELAFDIGTFFFDHDHGLLKSFPFLRNCLVPIIPKQVRITPKGNFDVYPITLKGFMNDNGFLITLLSLFDLWYGKARHYRRNTVPAFTKYYMGNMIYTRSGLKYYIERLYGLEDKEVGVEFAQQRLLPLTDYTLAGWIKKKAIMTRDYFHGCSPKHAWVRPVEGFTGIYGPIENHLKEKGVRIFTNCLVASVSIVGGKFEVKFDGTNEIYDRVISTIPIPAMLRLIGRRDSSTFESMNLMSLFYQGRLKVDAHAIYNYTHEGQWKRLTNFTAFYGRQSGHDYFTVEVTVPNVPQNNYKYFKDEFEDHAIRLGVLLGAPTFMGSSLTKNAYPIFRPGDPIKTDHDKEQLKSYGIDFLGRQGNFEYLSSTQAATNALALAESILDDYS
jgi:hypothetical protein